MKILKTSHKVIWLYKMVSIAVTIGLIFSYCAILQMEARVRVPLLWIHGLIVALVLGYLWTVTFLKLIRNYIYRYTLKRKQTIEDIYIDPLAVPAGWQAQ